ncbi:MAG: guanylate kinase [Patescibacteria group bacterium]
MTAIAPALSVELKGTHPLRVKLQPDVIAELKRAKALKIFGCSGAGKTELIKALLTKRPDRLCRVVTTTTRPPRSGEVESIDYHFLGRPNFEKGIVGGDFIEYDLFGAVGNKNYYGVSVAALRNVWALGKVPVLNITVGGIEQVNNLMPGTPAIFIDAPFYVLEERLKARGDSEDDIKARLAEAQQEKEIFGRYCTDVVLNTGTIEAGVSSLLSIVDSYLRTCPSPQD